MACLHDFIRWYGDSSSSWEWNHHGICRKCAFDEETGGPTKHRCAEKLLPYEDCPGWLLGKRLEEPEPKPFKPEEPAFSNTWLDVAADMIRLGKIEQALKTIGEEAGYSFTKNPPPPPKNNEVLRLWLRGHGVPDSVNEVYFGLANHEGKEVNYPSYGRVKLDMSDPKLSLNLLFAKYDSDEPFQAAKLLLMWEPDLYQIETRVITLEGMMYMAPGAAMAVTLRASVTYD